MKCDYLIIGAGLAGSTCAYLLKSAGKNVVLLERADAFMKEKLCGGMLSPRSIRLAEQLFGEDVKAIYRTQCETMRVLAYVEVMDIEAKLNTVRRQELDRIPLLRFLDLGGMLIDRARWELSEKSKCVYATTPEGEITIEFNTLIAADGANSQVRRTLTGDLSAKKKGAELLPSLEAICQNTGDPITIQYEPKLQGYSWYIPCGDSANIGCMAGNADVDLRGCFEAFVQKVGVTPERARGAFLPSGSDVVLEQQGVYFLGDAAGLICPPSGEGIFYAMESAVQLADALTHPRSMPYGQRMDKHVKDIRKQYLAKPIMLNQPLLTVASLATGLVGVDKEALLSFAFKNFVGFTGV